jgi:hypothetical protein
MRTADDPRKCAFDTPWAFAAGEGVATFSSARDPLPQGLLKARDSAGRA